MIHPQVEYEISGYSIDEGLSMNFKAYTMDVVIEPERAHQLLNLTKKLLDGPIPTSNNDYKDCLKIRQLYDIITTDQTLLS